MKYKVMMLVPMLFVVAACATDGRPSTAAERAMASAGCSEGNLKFHVGDSYLFVTPKNKCVDRGMSYEAEIKEHGISIAVGDANITGSDTWLNATNSPDAGIITITVAEDAPLGDHKYELIVDDVGRLDPVVRVRTSGDQ
jgi:hypothetical protein